MLHHIVDYENLCSEILKTDSNIRFVAVYNQWTEKQASKMKEGLSMYLPEWLTHEAVEQTIQIWKIRQKMGKWIGMPKFAMAEYEKIIRFVFYLNENEFLLVTTEHGIDQNSLKSNIESIFEIKIKKVL